MQQKERPPIHLKSHRKAEPTPTPTPLVAPPVVIQLPSIGNLKQRAITLSQEIMEDLTMHGWRSYNHPPNDLIPPMPTTQDGQQAIMEWMQNRSTEFRGRFFKRALDLRNEFSELHLRDESLDDFFMNQGVLEDAKKRMSGTGLNPLDFPIPTLEIEEVAERLQVLAGQIKGEDGGTR
jgi:hypothetical protein